MAEKNDNKKLYEVFLTKYISIGIIIILLTIVFVPSFYLHYFEINSLKKEINLLKNDTNYNISGTGVYQIYEKRLENIENKYVDVIASTETINFWMTIFAFLFPSIFGFFIYQKGKFEDKAESELKKMKESKKEAESIIGNLEDSSRIINENLVKRYEYYDNILNSKIEEYESFITNAKENYNELVNQISIYSKNSIKNNDVKNSEDKKQLFDKGNSYIDNKDFLGAIKIFTELINIDDYNPLHYWFRGLSYLYLDDYNNAILDFEKYLKLGGNGNDDSFTFIRLASLYSLDNNIIKSIEKLDEAYNRDYFKDSINILMLNNKDFDNIRETPEFQEFIKKLKEKYPEETSKNS